MQIRQKKTKNTHPFKWKYVKRGWDKQVGVRLGPHNFSRRERGGRRNLFLVLNAVPPLSCGDGCEGEEEIEKGSFSFFLSNFLGEFMGLFVGEVERRGNGLLQGIRVSTPCSSSLLLLSLKAEAVQENCCSEITQGNRD